VVAEVLKAMKNDVERATLVPSGGGIFEVRLNGNTIFSKKETGRFPEEGEVVKRVRQTVA